MSKSTDVASLKKARLWMALVIVLALAFGIVTYRSCADQGDESPAAQESVTTQDQPPATGSDGSGPADVDNPLPVGQAVDALVRPAIAEVLGEPVLTRASSQLALTVNLTYETPNAAAEGDGEILRDALISRGATLDPEHSEMDYHAESEQGFVLYDTGDPAFPSVRISITPGSNDVYVNADRAQ